MVGVCAAPYAFSNGKAPAFVIETEGERYLIKESVLRGYTKRGTNGAQDAPNKRARRQ